MNDDDDDGGGDDDDSKGVTESLRDISFWLDVSLVSPVISNAISKLFLIVKV